MLSLDVMKRRWIECLEVKAANNAAGVWLVKYSAHSTSPSNVATRQRESAARTVSTPNMEDLKCVRGY
jgi:hypothetical protein